MVQTWPVFAQTVTNVDVIKPGVHRPAASMHLLEMTFMQIVCVCVCMPPNP